MDISVTRQNDRELIRAAAAAAGHSQLAALIGPLRAQREVMFPVFLKALWACTLEEEQLPSPDTFNVAPLVPGISGLTEKTRNGNSWRRTGFISAFSGKLMLGISRPDGEGGIYNEMGDCTDGIAVLFQSARPTNLPPHLSPDDCVDFLSADTVRLFIISSRHGTQAYLKTVETPRFTFPAEAEQRVLALTGERLVSEPGFGEFSAKSCRELRFASYRLEAQNFVRMLDDKERI